MRPSRVNGAFFFVIQISIVSSLNVRRNETIARIFFCLNAVIHVQSTYENFILLGEESHENQFMPIALALPWPRTIVAKPYDQILPNANGLYILFPDTNATNYDKFLRVASSNYQAQYVVFTEAYRNIFYIFDLFWHHKILDVVALYYSRSGDIAALTYFPFGRRGCSNSLPYKINEWNPSLKKFQVKEKLFSRKNKIHNLHSCPVKVASQMEQIKGLEGNLDRRTDGLSLRIFRFLEKRANFSSILVETEKESNAYAAAYMNFTTASVFSVLRGEADVAIGWFSMLSDSNPDATTPVQISMDCFTWAVPIKAGSKPSMWTTYFYEFDPQTWIALSVTYAVVTLFFRFLFQWKDNGKDPFSKSFSFSYIFAMFLGVSVKSKPKVHSLRIFYIHWTIFCIVVVAAYNASLGSLVMVPPDSRNIADTSELLDTDLILTGEPKLYYILSASSSTSKLMALVLDRFQTLNPGAFLKTMYMIYSTRRFAVFYTSDKLSLAEKIVQRQWNLSDAVHIVPKCLISSHISPFMLKKGSVFEERFNRIAKTLIESGIISKWEKELKDLDEKYQPTYNGSSEESHVQQYSVAQLKGGLIILCAGFLTSCVVFLTEVLSKGFAFNQTSRR